MYRLVAIWLNEVVCDCWPCAAVESDIMAVAEVNGAQAYVPYSYARDRIGLIMDDMRKLKSSHVTIVHGIENNYRKIEDETQVMTGGW